MSIRITIEIKERPEKKTLDVVRKVEEEQNTVTVPEKKLAVWYLLALGRGVANFGLEKYDPAMLASAADFVADARKVYADAVPEERKA